MRNSNVLATMTTFPVLMIRSQAECFFMASGVSRRAVKVRSIWREMHEQHIQSFCRQFHSQPAFQKSSCIGKRRICRCGLNNCSFNCFMSRRWLGTAASVALSDQPENEGTYLRERGHSASVEKSNRKLMDDIEKALDSLVTKRYRERLQDDTLAAMTEYLQRLQVDVSGLSVIHVAGTKGKGSTCTMAESILRSQGLRTGLYTSPHLIDIRERIRINGKLLPAADFSRYFWHVHSELSRTEAQSAYGMPGYFRFLTCLAFKIFVSEGIDVAVIEVGLGGRLDATNVVNPVVCGVSSLGLDHTQVLGDTIEEIAWEKAGIFKAGVPAITVDQVPAAAARLHSHAAAVGCPLYTAPPIDAFLPDPPLPAAAGDGGAVEVGIVGDVQRVNAGLAVSLCRAWQLARGRSLAAAPPAEAELFRLPAEFRAGLADARMIGRCQSVRLEPVARAGWAGREVQLYIDGAHTKESMLNGAAWFRSCFLPPPAAASAAAAAAAESAGEGRVSGAETAGKSAAAAAAAAAAAETRGVGELAGAAGAAGVPAGRRVLLFYCSPDRDPRVLLQPLAELHRELRFDGVALCPNLKPALAKDMPLDAWMARLRAYLTEPGPTQIDAPIKVFDSVYTAARDLTSAGPGAWWDPSPAAAPAAESTTSPIPSPPAGQSSLTKGASAGAVGPLGAAAAAAVAAERVHVYVTGSLLVCGDLLRAVLKDSD